TGKTTTLNAIISLFEQQGEKVLIAAPTGRAAKRISDLTGYDARTIHRMLDMQQMSGSSEEQKASGMGKFRFVHNENNLLDCDVMIIDEMSMVDTLLFEALLRTMPLGCKLIMVGDSDQLPSVGAGNLLKDLIDSEIVPVVALKEIFRQAQNSCIVTNAHRIIRGELPEISRKDSDFFFFQRLDFEAAADTVVSLVKDRLPKAYGFLPIEDIQVLSPTRKGPLGVSELNKRLQQELNPPSKELSEIKLFNYTFRENDKVMQTKNNYDIVWKRDEENGAGVFNGDIGKILEVNKSAETVKIDFDGRICIYNSAMLESLELAYCVTVHKSQGSEFDVVVLPILGGYDKLCYRNLLYTAVTRAKKMLIIIGSVKRLEFMIENNRRTYRYSCLKAMLQNEAEGTEQ
ncbi:MAG: AAA family ATPase, partial [Oscillospiraceae bacterium]